MVTPAVPQFATSRPHLYRRIVLAVIACVAAVVTMADTVTVRADGVWTASAANPLLSLYKAPLALDDRAPAIWNDPSVLAEPGGFSMWASMGRGDAAGVAIYHLRSADGETWTVSNGGRPVLQAGAPADFDAVGVETPAVIKVGNTYHMYYSAFSHGRFPLVTIGHATSRDGDTWQKKGELTSVTAMVGNPAGNPWGWLGRGEPTVTYQQGKFYLYFTDVKCRQADCGGGVPALRGISLATSTDGQRFVQSGTTPLIVQTAAFPAGQGWEGYSTPAVVFENGRFELFCDVFRNIRGKSIQTALTHFSSIDGVHFTESEVRTLSAGDELWSQVSVRSPSVVVSNGIWRMWYAGDNWDPEREAPSSGAVNAGIGVATLVQPW